MRVSVHHSVRGFSHINSLCTGSQIENQTQMHIKLNDITFPHTMCIIYTAEYNLFHVRVDVGNYLSQLSSMLDFEGTETLGNRFKIFVGTFHMLCSLYRFTQKSCALNCTAYSGTKELYVTLCFTCLLQTTD
jgi:hypothetical protein